MKARVKATGEIVEVLKIENDCNGNPIYKNMSKSFFGQSELDFDHDVCDDYWEKLKHQYAGMAMQGLILTASKHMGTDQEVAQWAKEYAHALVEKMKKKEEKK